MVMVSLLMPVEFLKPSQLPVGIGSSESLPPEDPLPEPLPEPEEPPEPLEPVVPPPVEPVLPPVEPSTEPLVPPSALITSPSAPTTTPPEPTVPPATATSFGSSWEPQAARSRARPDAAIVIDVRRARGAKRGDRTTGT